MIQLQLKNSNDRFSSFLYLIFSFILFLKLVLTMYGGILLF